MNDYSAQREDIAYQAGGQSIPDGGVAQLRFTAQPSSQMGIMVIRVSH